MNIQNIYDHMAYTHDCGSVRFHLLRSGAIECANCNEKLEGMTVSNIDNTQAVSNAAAIPHAEVLRAVLNGCEAVWTNGAGHTFFHEGLDALKEIATFPYLPWRVRRPAMLASSPEFAKPAVPQGWKMVPLEPTKAMLEAAVKSRHGPATYKATSAGLEEEEAADDYRAMLAASPASPAPQPSLDVERERRDAERYRFIRDTLWTPELSYIIQSQQNSRWDAAIDAARAEKESKHD